MGKIIKDKLKLYSVDFEPMYPVGCHLFLYAKDIGAAVALTKETVLTKVKSIKEVPYKEGIVSYDSGDY